MTAYAMHSDCIDLLPASPLVDCSTLARSRNTTTGSGSLTTGARGGVGTRRDHALEDRALPFHAPGKVFREISSRLSTRGSGYVAPGAARALTNHSGDAYDPFVGSGTTIIAAEQLGRRCYAMEIDPRYVAVAIKRWEDFTGRRSERIDG